MPAKTLVYTQLYWQTSALVSFGELGVSYTRKSKFLPLEVASILKVFAGTVV